MKTDTGTTITWADAENIGNWQRSPTVKKLFSSVNRRTV